MTTALVTREQLLNEWTVALRSGDYPQGKNRLAVVRPGFGVVGYCCLGVLCEIGLKYGIISERRVLGNCIEYVGDNSSQIHLPLKLSAIVDFNADKHSKFVSMNDNEGKTFAEIADWIDENLLRKDS